MKTREVFKSPFVITWYWILSHSCTFPLSLGHQAPSGLRSCYGCPLICCLLFSVTPKQSGSLGRFDLSGSMAPSTPGYSMMATPGSTRVGEQIHGLVQDCRNSSASAMELLQSCTKPSRYTVPCHCSTVNFLQNLHKRTPTHTHHTHTHTSPTCEGELRLFYI